MGLAPNVSIVILTKNAGGGFRATLQKIYDQETDLTFELGAADSPVADQASGADGGEPAEKGEAAKYGELELFARRKIAQLVLLPGGQEIEGDDIQDAQADGGKFDVDEGIANVFGGPGGQQAGATECGDGKSRGGHGHCGPADVAERNVSPETQQAQVKDQDGTEQRGHAQDMDEIHNAVGPDPMFAHGVAERRELQPRHELV